jgi:hypothetical protein
MFQQPDNHQEVSKSLLVIIVAVHLEVPVGERDEGESIFSTSSVI